MLIVSHPTGNAFNRATLVSLHEAGILKEFQTTIASYPGNLWSVIGNRGWGREFRRRKYDKRLKPVTFQHPVRELGRLLANRFNLRSLTRHETGIFCIDAVYREIDKKTARRLTRRSDEVNGVYAYEDGAVESFKAARRLGLIRFYDLPIGYWRTGQRLLRAEASRRPEWAETLPGLKDSVEKLLRKDEELALADRIYVASSFTAKTLLDFPGTLAPIIVVPYGFPPVTITREYSQKGNNKKLRLLFVGGLSQRKGIASVFDAVKKLSNHVELTVVGRKSVDNCVALNEALCQCRWILSLPHNEILELMKTQDVLVFPSLFEGFGLVITEAMSQGLPVITTDRTAGLDLIEHGNNGWLIRAGSTESLVEEIENLLECRSRIIAAGKAAMETARNRPWHVYGTELSKSILETLHP